MARKVDSQWVWMDGDVVPADEAKISFFAHAVHYGTAVFEGIRCYETEKGPAIFRLREHLERLRASARGYYMEYGWTDEELEAACVDLVRRHGFKSCYVRPVVLTGEGEMGVKPRDCVIQTLITVWSWGAYLGPEALEKGVRATIVPRRKYSPKALDPTIKATGHYLNSVVATKQAAAAGYDEAILLNEHERVAEGPGENIFLVKGSEIVTAPVEESLLLGITRDSIMTIARDLGHEVVVRPITVEDLKGADEAFFTGTAAEVTPIASVDDEPIGAGSRGPVTEKIQSTYLDAVAGKAPRYTQWLTVV